jgi:hypothetical protein
MVKEQSTTRRVGASLLPACRFLYVVSHFNAIEQLGAVSDADGVDGEVGSPFDEDPEDDVGYDDALQ